MSCASLCPNVALTCSCLTQTAGEKETEPASKRSYRARQACTGRRRRREKCPATSEKEGKGAEPAEHEEAKEDKGTRGPEEEEQGGCHVASLLPLYHKHMHYPSIHQAHSSVRAESGVVVLYCTLHTYGRIRNRADGSPAREHFPADRGHFLAGPSSGIGNRQGVSACRQCDNSPRTC